MRSSRPQKARAQDDEIKAHPLESPLNGGMNSTIPLLGEVPLAAGRVPFSVSQSTIHRAKSGYFSMGKMRSLS